MEVKFVVFVIVISSFISEHSVSGLAISEKEYNVLPPIFQIDDYDKCLQDETKVFCKARIKLKPLEESSPIWKLIQATKKDKYFYNHDDLFHAVCVNLQNSTAEQLARIYSEQYKSLGMTAGIVTLDCKNYDNIFTMQLYDLIGLVLAGLYISVIIGSTYYDWKTSKNKNKYVISFSLIDNWGKFIEGDSKTKLSHIQGIRFITTTLIIIVHSYSSYIAGYVDNTDYFENFSKNVFKLAILSSFSFVVQTYFLLSGWFLSQSFFRNFPPKKFIFKYVVLTLLNRYLRLLPVVLLSVWIIGANIPYKLMQGPVQEQYGYIAQRACRKNWWAVLCYVINQFPNLSAMCNPVTWYLSADIQLYVVSLAALALVRWLKTGPLTIFGIVALIGITISSVVNFIYDTEVIFRMIPETIKMNMVTSEGDFSDFSVTYISMHLHMATYMLGLAFGYIHFTTQDSKLFKGQFRRLLWWVAFIGLPSLAMFLSSCDFDSKMLRMVLAGVLKPVYALGIGIGVLGMSHQLGGFLKKICSWRPFVVLGNCTFSTYLTHVLLVFGRACTARKPRYVTDWIMLSSWCQDIIVSFTVGVACYLFVELPFFRLQTLCVPRFKNPQVKKKKK